MSAPFHRSLRSLSADGGDHKRQGLLVAGLLCTMWSAWFFLFPISLYAVSSEARVEVSAAMHPLESAVEGKVVASSLLLNRLVSVGEVLVQLETKSLEIELSGKRQRVDSIVAQVGPLKREIEATMRALSEHEMVARAQVTEARARLRGAGTLAEFAQSQADRSAILWEHGGVTASDHAKTTTEGRMQRANADALEITVGRIDAESRFKRSELDQKLAKLARELALLHGTESQERVAIAALLQDIELRSIRAPVSGRLGEASQIRAGSVVTKGIRLGAVIPPGPLRVTADFLPAVVLGRVRPGQPARLRLDGFPWAEYGMVPLSVLSVGSELRNGKVRVELQIAGSMPLKIPMQHGLPGSVEVEVEQAFPAQLVLRSAGRMLENPLSSSGH